MIFLSHKLINLLKERNIHISNRHYEVDGDLGQLIGHMYAHVLSDSLPYETLCDCLLAVILDSNLTHKELEIETLMQGIKDEMDPQDYSAQLKKNLEQSIVYDYATDTRTRPAFHIVRLIKGWLDRGPSGE
jgi:hypothetical protein